MKNRPIKFVRYNNLSPTSVPLKEMQAGFMSLDLSQLRKDAEEIAGGWNGGDLKFQVGGIVYTEEDAELASDIVTACKELEALLEVWAELK